MRLLISFADEQVSYYLDKKFGYSTFWYNIGKDFKVVNDLIYQVVQDYSLERRFVDCWFVITLDGNIVPSMQPICILKENDTICFQSHGSDLLRRRKKRKIVQNHEDDRVVVTATTHDEKHQAKQIVAKSNTMQSKVQQNNKHACGINDVEPEGEISPALLDAPAPKRKRRRRRKAMQPLELKTVPLPIENEEVQDFVSVPNLVPEAVTKQHVRFDHNNECVDAERTEDNSLLVDNVQSYDANSHDTKYGPLPYDTCSTTCDSESFEKDREAKKKEFRESFEWKKPYRVIASVHGTIASSKHEQVNDVDIKISNCPVLTSNARLKKSDRIAYKVVELCESTWQPMVSEYRFAEIVSHEGSTIQALPCQAIQSGVEQLEIIPTEESSQFELDFSSLQDTRTLKSNTRGLITRL